MKGYQKGFYLAVLVLLGACESSAPPPTERIPRRTMGVMAGPELVFNRPVAEVLPQLEGAVATGQNGRVGSELVFWSYRLADGRDVLFYACAELEGVQCAERSARICRVGKPQFLFSGRESGEVRKLDCPAVATARVGDQWPGCVDFNFENPLVLGLASCP